MTLDDRTRWDRKHAESVGDRPPDPRVEELLARVPAPPGSAPNVALDVACGGGRHLASLARSGWRAEGIDVSSVAIEAARRRLAREGLHAELAVADFDVHPLGAERYGLLLVVDFLARPRFPDLARALAPGGALLVVGFLEGHAHLPARWCHRAGELAAAFASFEIDLDEEREGRLAFLGRKPVAGAATIAPP